MVSLDRRWITYAMHNPIIAIHTIKKLIQWWALNTAAHNYVYHLLSFFLCSEYHFLCLRTSHNCIWVFFCLYLFSSMKLGYMSYFAIVTKTKKNNISLNFWSNTKIRLILLLSTDYTQLNFSLNLQRFSSLGSFVLLCSYVLCNVIHFVSLVLYLGRFFFVKKTVETIFRHSCFI